MQIWPRAGLRKILLSVLLGALILIFSCSSKPKFPKKDSTAYKNVVSAFYIGLSALQVGDDVHAESNSPKSRDSFPASPPDGRTGASSPCARETMTLAAQRLQKARDLAPQNDQIYNLLGILESQRGNSAQAIADLRKAVELNPQNLRAIYSTRGRN